MGVGVVNIYLRPHVQSDAIYDGEIRVHHGNLNVDTTSPTITGSQWRSIRSAADDATDFGDAVAAIGGSFLTWFLALSSAHQEKLRLGFLA